MLELAERLARFNRAHPNAVLMLYHNGEEVLATVQYEGHRFVSSARNVSLGRAIDLALERAGDRLNDGALMMARAAGTPAGRFAERARQRAARAEIRNAEAELASTPLEDERELAVGIDRTQRATWAGARCRECTKLLRFCTCK